MDELPLCAKCGNEITEVNHNSIIEHEICWDFSLLCENCCGTSHTFDCQKCNSKTFNCSLCNDVIISQNSIMFENVDDSNDIIYFCNYHPDTKIEKYLSKHFETEEVCPFCEKNRFILIKRKHKFCEKEVLLCSCCSIALDEKYCKDCLLKKSFKNSCDNCSKNVLSINAKLIKDITCKACENWFICKSCEIICWLCLNKKYRKKCTHCNIYNHRSDFSGLCNICYRAQILYSGLGNFMFLKIAKQNIRDHIIDILLIGFTDKHSFLSQLPKDIFKIIALHFKKNF